MALIEPLVIGRSWLRPVRLSVTCSTSRWPLWVVIVSAPHTLESTSQHPPHSLPPCGHSFVTHRSCGPHGRLLSLSSWKLPADRPVVDRGHPGRAVPPPPCPRGWWRPPGTSGR